MSKRIPYSYTVLRYVHDVATGEFVNVGVVVASSDASFIGAKFKTAYGRLKKVFPSVDGEQFRSRIRCLQRSFDERRRAAEAELRLSSGAKIHDLVHTILPKDDSSLQWSPSGSGLCRDPSETLDSLYQRFVSKYDFIDIGTEKRKDVDVWKEFRTELEKRHLTKYLAPKTIESSDDEVRFEHAWKNSTWHCYEPLSFDLASASSIREKAHKWLGQVASVQDGASESFKVYFVVGRPSEPMLETAYRQALAILQKADQVELIEEAHVDAFSDRLEQQIKQHLLVVDS